MAGSSVRRSPRSGGESPRLGAPAPVDCAPHHRVRDAGAGDRGPPVADQAVPARPLDDRPRDDRARDRRVHLSPAPRQVAGPDLETAFCSVRSPAPCSSRDKPPGADGRRALRMSPRRAPGIPRPRRSRRSCLRRSRSANAARNSWYASLFQISSSPLSLTSPSRVTGRRRTSPSCTLSMDRVLTGRTPLLFRSSATSRRAGPGWPPPPRAAPAAESERPPGAC
jgi:hypothetical protein